MEPISLISVVLTVIASALSAVTTALSQRRKRRGLAINSLPEPYRTANAKEEDVMHLRMERRGMPAGMVVLLTFASIIFLFGAFSLFYYWPLITTNAESLMFALWLFFAMIGGMFVQVLAANYRAGRPLFDVTASQLVFPLLFALIVYYPIWVLAASSPHNLFSFYAAFLNGYFWESVVSAARVPSSARGTSNDA